MVRPKMLIFHAGMYLPHAFPTGYESSCATKELIKILGRRMESSILIPDPIVVKRSAIAHILIVF